jgi:hypothetical protein
MKIGLVCQDKSTARYERILLICSSASLTPGLWGQPKADRRSDSTESVDVLPRCAISKRFRYETNQSPSFVLFIITRDVAWRQKKINNISGINILG